jgi:hypothetical protein
MTKSEYIKMCNIHLSDKSSYIEYNYTNDNYQLEFSHLDTILNFYNKSKSDIKRGFNNDLVIGQSKLYLSLMQLSINPENLKTSSFYCLPKMHKKTPDGLPIPGRPIVSSINSLTYFTSSYLQNYLSDLANKLPGICRSSKEVLHVTHNIILPLGSMILCADVKSLYPSIPIDYGLKAIKNMLYRYNMLDISFHLDLLRWVLTNNIFEFNNIYYKQIQGTAMGTPVAVSYANIVLCYLEQECLDNFKPIIYLRYIDDLFVVCQSIVIANNIVACFNSKCTKIQLDEVTIAREGIFLDLKITISDNNKLISNIYQKEMNKYLYIPKTSNHSIKIITNMINQEIKRYRLHCTEDIDFFTVKSLFKCRLIDRGYTLDYLDPLFNITYCRETLLTNSYIKKKKNISTDKPIIPILLPVLINPINIKKLFSLPDVIVNTFDYNKVYKNNNIMIGRCCYPSIGRTLTFLPLNRQDNNNNNNIILNNNNNIILNNNNKRRLEEDRVPLIQDINQALVVQAKRSRP